MNDDLRNKIIAVLGHTLNDQCGNRSRIFVRSLCKSIILSPDIKL